jgi:hypothetical protein
LAWDQPLPSSEQLSRSDYFERRKTEHVISITRAGTRRQAGGSSAESGAAVSRPCSPVAAQTAILASYLNQTYMLYSQCCDPYSIVEATRTMSQQSRLGRERFNLVPMERISATIAWRGGRLFASVGNAGRR